MSWQDAPLVENEASQPAWMAAPEVNEQQQDTRPPTYISKPGTRELDDQGVVHRFVRPGLEALGMAGGAVIGSPMGPIGAAGGGALGFAGGDALASLAERFAGERPPIQSLEQAGRETLGHLKSGGLVEAGGRLVGAALSKLLAPFADQLPGENQHIQQIAKERGITLDPHEVLQNRPLALSHKVLENIPFTSGMIQRAEKEKLQSLVNEWQKTRDAAGAPDRQRLAEIGTKIQDEVEKQVAKTGARQEEVKAGLREDVLHQIGSPLTYKELGLQTQKAVTDLHQAKKDIEGLAWEHAREGIPEGVRIPSTNLKDTAAQIYKKYKDIPSFLDEPILKQVTDAKKSGNEAYDRLVAAIPEGLAEPYKAQMMKEVLKQEKPGWSVQSLITLRGILSDKMAEHHSGLMRGDAAKGSMDQYGKAYNDLKFAIDKDLDQYSKTSGNDLAERFAMARHLSGERMAMMNPKENPYVMKTLNAEAETLHKALIQPGNAAGYTQLKEVVGDHGVAPVKKAFTNQLLGVGAKEVDGIAGLRASLDRYGSQTLAEVYSPTEIKQLYNLADKTKWMKESPVGNPFFRELIRSSPNQVAPSILADANLTSKTIRAFPNMKQPLRQAFVDSLHPNTNTAFPTQLLKQLNSYPKEVQKQLFSDSEMADFYQLAKIAERTKGSVKLAENPSGTAQNITAYHTLLSLLKNPILNAPGAVGAATIGKLYLSPLGRKYLIQGLSNPEMLSKGGELGTKIAALMASDAIDAKDLKKQNQER